MALVDDENVQWPDAVKPGSRAATVLLARARDRERATDARREQLAAEKPKRS